MGCKYKTQNKITDFFVCSVCKDLRSVSARKMESLVNNKEMLVLSNGAFCYIQLHAIQNGRHKFRQQIELLLSV